MLDNDLLTKSEVVVPKKQSPSPLLGEYALEDLHVYRVNRHTFEIFLFGEDRCLDGETELPQEPGIEYQMAGRFIINLTLLSRIDRRRPILIHMKTDGGHWQEGMAIYDAIRACPNPVTILSYTHARSMSSIVLQAADRRVMMAHGYFLFHLGTMEFSGPHNQVMQEAKQAERDKEAMLGIYVERASEGRKFKGFSKASIKQFLEREMEKKDDVILRPRQAIHWGFADAIFNGNWSRLRAKKKCH